MMEYFIAKEASQDLDEILDYFLVRNVNAGERFIRLNGLYIIYSKLRSHEALSCDRRKKLTEDAAKIPIV